MLRFLTRYHVMLWPAAVVLLAMAAAAIHPRPYDDGGIGSFSFGVIFTIGIPFVIAGRLVARWVGPGHGAWILPLSVPLGVLPYLLADGLLHRVARQRAARRVSAVLLALGLTGCSAGAPSGPDPSPRPGEVHAISLRNDTGQPLVYTAVGEGALALIDIAPTLMPGSYEDNLLPVGATVRDIEVIGFQADLGIAFYLWRVDPATGVATYTALHRVRAGELERSGGLIVLGRSDLSTAASGF